MTQGLKDRIGSVCGETPRQRARSIDQTPSSRTSSRPAAMNAPHQTGRIHVRTRPKRTEPSIKALAIQGAVHTCPRNRTRRSERHRGRRASVHVSRNATFRPAALWRIGLSRRRRNLRAELLRQRRASELFHNRLWLSLLPENAPNIRHATHLPALGNRECSF